MDKKCSKCKIIKDISMFYRNKYKIDGKQSHCKICHNETNMKWRKANPDKYSKYNCSPKRNEKQKTKSKLRSRKHRHDISDRYMRDTLCMNSDLEHEDITDEMIELARINLKIKRNLGLTKKLKNYE